MKVLRENNRSAAAPVLMQNGVVVLLTDTIYGIVARADHEAACERVRALKGRDADKAMIILAADASQLWGSADQQFIDRINVSEAARPTSIIVPASDTTPRWLPTPYDDTIAFRVPEDPDLQNLLRLTGPLVAPSANPQGKTPAYTIDAAVGYFGDGVDMYIDGGSAEGRQPSRLIRIYDDGKVEYLR